MSEVAFMVAIAAAIVVGVALLRRLLPHDGSVALPRVQAE